MAKSYTTPAAEIGHSQFVILSLSFFQGQERGQRPQISPGKRIALCTVEIQAFYYAFLFSIWSFLSICTLKSLVFHTFFMDIFSLH